MRINWHQDRFIYDYFSFPPPNHYSTDAPRAFITSVRCMIVSDPINMILRPSLELDLLAGTRLESNKRIFKVNICIFLFFHFYSGVRVINYQKGYKNNFD